MGVDELFLAGHKTDGDGDSNGAERTPVSSSGNGGDGRDPDNTRDMLWVYLERQNQSLDRNFDRHSQAVEANGKALDRLADIFERSMRSQTKVIAALGALLIIGVLALAGIDISAKVPGFGEVTTTGPSE